MPKKFRALLIAEACNPEWTSVPLVGYSHARALMKLTDAHLVTQVRNREALVRAGLCEGKDFTAIDSEAVTIRVRKVARLFGGKNGKGWTTLTAASALYYYYFEDLLWKKFRSRIESKEFDVVHRITPLSPTVPSILARRCREAGVPFVLGPLNGGVPWPKQFDSVRRQEREWLSYFRGLYRLLPGYQSTLEDSSLVVVGSRDTLKQIPSEYHHKCAYLPENGIDPERFQVKRTRRASVPLRVVFLGRLVPYKGADMLIDAAAPLLRAGVLELEIIGDGPQRETLKSMIESHGVSKSVKLSGWVMHQQIQGKLVNADVLAFPSIREFGGGVVLEAMAVGLVPIIVNYGGPGELVTEETGYRVPIDSRDEIVRSFRKVLSELCENPGGVDQKSESAIRHAMENFSWEQKAQRVIALWEEALNGGGFRGDVLKMCQKLAG